jgi:putative FmdB family regulatory protein
MPVYTFACPKCGLAVNKVSQVHDNPPKCPYCKLEMDRQIKPCAGFVFKGEGFFANDNTRYKPKQRSKICE